jgi:hypothetical protein
MNINSDFDLKKAKSFLLTENKEDYGTNALTGKPLPKPDPVVEAEELDEMAKISGDLKSAIEKVLDANKDLEGLALKKAIKGDSAVIDALDGEDLYDNQLNKFIALTKGERTLGQRGRKADPNKPAAEPKEPKAAKTPGEQKIKITPAKSKPATDDTSIDTGVEKDARSKDEMIKAKRDLEAKRMEIAKAYKDGDTSVLPQLKDLTAQINKLNKKLGV